MACTNILYVYTFVYTIYIYIYTSLSLILASSLFRPQEMVFDRMWEECMFRIRYTHCRSRSLLFAVVGRGRFRLLLSEETVSVVVVGRDGFGCCCRKRRFRLLLSEETVSVVVVGSDGFGCCCRKRRFRLLLSEATVSAVVVVGRDGFGCCCRKRQFRLLLSGETVSVILVFVVGLDSELEVPEISVNKVRDPLPSFLRK